MRDVAFPKRGERDPIRATGRRRPTPTKFLTSIGDVAYEWRLDTDALSWSGNAAAVLGVADAAGSPAAAATRSTSRRRTATAGSTRSCKLGHGDTGGGVAYQVQYAFQRADGETDSGWRTPAAGSPVPTASRCARTASCASSTSATSASSALT